MTESEFNFSTIIIVLFSDVLSNLTQLETLDISFNELETLESDGYNFTLPKNLTHLYISNNKLWTFPVNIFDNLTTVQLIDIENNSIEKFDLDLLKSVKTGLQLQISGIYTIFFVFFFIIERGLTTSLRIFVIIII